MSTNPNCHGCIYAWWDPCQALAGFAIGFPSRPTCANQPGVPGQARPTPLGKICRNYRPKPPTPKGDVERIPLGNDMYAYVDAADYEWLSRYHWRLHSGEYATRQSGGKRIFMHRDIMQPPRTMVVDHIDGNKLNNCRFNLRVCTRAENRRNHAKRANATSRFKGVVYRKDLDKYGARFKSGGQSTWLGAFDDEMEAARAYDYTAVEHGGAFAYVNFPEEWPPQRRAQVYAEWLKAQKRKTEARKKAKGKGRKAKGKRTAKRKPQNAKRTTKSPRATGHRSRTTASKRPKRKRPK